MIGELIPTGVTFGVGRVSLNTQFSGTADFNNVEISGNFSAGTNGIISSGGTDLYNIFSTSGSDTNFANTNLTFTGNRFHDLNGNSLLIGDSTPFSSGAFLYLDEVSGANIGYGPLNSLYFNSGITIDIYFAGQNSLSFNSSQTVFNDSNVDIDFRVKGVSNPNLIYVDAASGNVGIGKIPSSFDLDISGDTNVSGVIYSGGTDLYDIFGSVLSGNYLPLTVTGTTFVDVNDANLYFTGNTGTSITTAIVGGVGGNQLHALSLTDGQAILASQDVSSLSNFYVRVNQNDGISLIYDTGSTVTELNIDQDSIRVTRNSSAKFAGIIYNADYSDGFTSRSLIDRGYLESVIASATTGGASIDPYNDLGDVASPFTWNVSGDSTNYEVTLTAATTTVNLTNVRNGEYGTLIVNQDGVGGRAITLGMVNGALATHRVANGGGSSIVLTSNSGATDILTFTYNGSAMYWSVGNDYT